MVTLPNLFYFQMEQFYLMNVHFSLEAGGNAQQLCIIPEIWLTQNDSEIFYPLYSGDKINLAATNKERPQQHTWRKLNAVCHGTFGKYLKQNNAEEYNLTNLF